MQGIRYDSANPNGASKINVLDLSIFTIDTVQRLIDYLYLGDTLQDYAVHEYSKTLLTFSFSELIRSIDPVYSTSSREHSALRLAVLDYAQMRVIESGIPPLKTVWVTEMNENCPDWLYRLGHRELALAKLQGSEIRDSLSHAMTRQSRNCQRISDCS
ncbi:unnamed protein product [Fusarium venenatum]|uniref:Uncharacterized protein n=1 Tax=Fusarium venenatum TaxID=56646 RepID=A0A2L2SZ42_9HYPO|nr:uncharacterized protein FVRRES_06784 [Fusarium venenatum]CEI62348.1 unnamed protein product [Fusarium venenatum]